MCKCTFSLTQTYKRAVYSQSDNVHCHKTCKYVIYKHLHCNKTCKYVIYTQTLTTAHIATYMRKTIASRPTCALTNTRSDSLTI